MHLRRPGRLTRRRPRRPARRRRASCPGRAWRSGRCPGRGARRRTGRLRRGSRRYVASPIPSRIPARTPSRQHDHSRNRHPQRSPHPTIVRQPAKTRRNRRPSGPRKLWKIAVTSSLAKPADAVVAPGTPTTVEDRGHQQTTIFHSSEISVETSSRVELPRLHAPKRFHTTASPRRRPTSLPPRCRDLCRATETVPKPRPGGGPGVRTAVPSTWRSVAGQGAVTLDSAGPVRCRRTLCNVPGTCARKSRPVQGNGTAAGNCGGGGVRSVRWS